LLGLRIDALRDVPELLATTSAPLRPPEGWDGRAAERLAEVLGVAVGAGPEREVAAAALGA